MASSQPCSPAVPVRAEANEIPRTVNHQSRLGFFLYLFFPPRQLQREHPPLARPSADAYDVAPHRSAPGKRLHGDHAGFERLRRQFKATDNRRPLPLFQTGHGRGPRIAHTRTLSSARERLRPGISLSISPSFLPASFHRLAFPPGPPLPALRPPLQSTVEST